MDYSDFANFLNERMRERNLTFKRLSELTGVSVRHLEALSSGNPDRLPSAPYLKGYLSRLGEVLGFDPDEAWKEMKKLTDAKSAGKSDEPARNRFSREPISGYMLAGIVVFFLLLYAGLRFYKISGTPSVTISYPQENMVVVGENSFLLAGSVSNSSELKINGEQVQVQPDGSWQKTVSLQPGINTVEITAKKFLGRETKAIRQIIYQQNQGF
ncbi:MAG: helix-turn-helix domain-containing protein [Candidatus Liptonbacteria bacterium]|nr:helix-turn-helix domain-containing protein [Candidatus Liptonbacteria bacterium]